MYNVLISNTNQLNNSINNFSYAGPQAINWPSLQQNFPATNQPTYTGSTGDDFVQLDNQGQGGRFNLGAGNDTVNYLALGTQNTFIDGGAGNNTFSTSGLSLNQLLTAIKSGNYSFIQFPNGFGLQTPDGKVIKVVNVQNIKTADASLDLTKATDLQTLVDALKANGIPIIDKTSQRCNGRRHHRQYNQYNNQNNQPYNRPIYAIPVVMLNNGSLASTNSSYQPYQSYPAFSSYQDSSAYQPYSFDSSYSPYGNYNTGATDYNYGLTSLSLGDNSLDATYTLDGSGQSSYGYDNNSYDLGAYGPSQSLSLNDLFA
jgi:hypothetical protein